MFLSSTSMPTTSSENVKSDFPYTSSPSSLYLSLSLSFSFQVARVCANSHFCRYLNEGIPLDATEFGGTGALLAILDGKQGVRQFV
jgi:hypothetical protein